MPSCLEFLRIFRRQESSSQTLDGQAPKDISTSSSLASTRSEFQTHQSGVPSRSSPVTGQQKALYLYGPKQKYTLNTEHDIPDVVGDDELLLRVQVVGLNPIDWKAPDYNFGIPALPYICGRDLVGIIIKAPRQASHLKAGDVVAAVSTDYRDFRKAAFQEYAVTSVHNAWRVPLRLSREQAASIGVAFVTAVLALGACLGVRFGTLGGNAAGPDLIEKLSCLEISKLPEDVRPAVQNRLSENERPMPGDWIAIWGGSSATGFLSVQLAKSAGLKVACIVDVAKHGGRLVELGADILVDRADPDRAVSIIKSVTKGRLRFSVDTVGKETASLLRSTMSVPDEHQQWSSHIVGLTGLPKNTIEGIRHHNVPVKLFHMEPEIGSSVMLWLEEILASDSLAGPDIEVAKGGLEGVNDALDSMRIGRHSGKRVVVPL